METKIEVLDGDRKNYRKVIKNSGEILKNGGLVAFPTETVYGLGANGLDDRAVRKIYRAKGRPSDNPLILHISHIDELEGLVAEVSKEAKLCIDSFWPGPLTIIFKKSKQVPDIITGGLDTVAIRMPENKIARDIIRQAGLPIAAPSANTSGRPSPTRASHVIEDLNGRVDMIVDGGHTEIGLESTVLDLSTNEPTILRPGKLSKKDLLEVIPNVQVDRAVLEMETIPKSPGQKYKHYAPEAKMFLVMGEDMKVSKKINDLAEEYKACGKKVGILTSDENMKNFSDEYNIISLGSKYSYDELNKNLFNSLRQFDKLGVDIILSEAFYDEELSVAIMNRLKKASGGNIINV